MNLDIFPQQLQLFLLISVRILVIVSLIPVISNQYAPFFVRFALAALTAFAVQNFVKETMIVPQTIGHYFVILAGEALIGAIIGFFIQMSFALLSMFSEFFSTQMGLRAAQVIDPLSQDSTAVVGQLISMIVMLVFISSHGLQRVFYYGIAQSFIALNSTDLFSFNGGPKSFMSFLFVGFATLFERTFIIALPLFTILLLVNVGMGLYGKIAPQMNLLVLGIPLQIGIGFLALLIVMPHLISTMKVFFERIFEYLTTFLREVQS